MHTEKGPVADATLQVRRGCCETARACVCVCVVRTARQQIVALSDQVVSDGVLRVP